MAESSSCEVCSKILNAFHSRDDTAVFLEYNLGDLIAVTNMPCPHSDSILELWQHVEKQRFSVQPGPRSVEISLNTTWGVEILFSSGGERQGSVYIDLVARDELGHPGTSTLFNWLWIDPSVLKSWYAACLHEHGPECQEPPRTESQPGIIAHPDWLIDVMDQCIVPFSSGTARYITLSYTWGNVQCLQNNSVNLKQLSEAGSLHPSQEPNVPRTVRDAIEITNYLGERYLWVDSLCIVQDNDDSVRRNLSIMHRIYSRSTLCLVAYAGTDANHGLRGIDGISVPRWAEQIDLDIACGERLSYFNKPRLHRADEGKTYNERGWTYQEFAFAKRRLIFTDGPLRWICKSTHYGEETRSGLKWDNWTPTMPSMKWMDTKFPCLFDMSTIARDYADRHFTFQGDALKAFLGIQSHLNLVFHGGLNYGHPEIFFDISLTWTANFGITRRIVPADVSPDQYNLPSWSWMGWRGCIGFVVDAEYDLHVPRRDGFTESITEWFAMRSPSTSDMRPVNCRWHHYKTLFQDDPSHVLDGWEAFIGESGSILYRVISDPRAHIDRNYSRYPVPIPSSAEATKPIEQLQFLFAKTTRGTFATRPLILPSFHSYAVGDFVELCSKSGEFAGFLRLHQYSEVDRFLALGTVELVAVVKGWTTDLDDFVLASQEQEKLMATTGLSPAPSRSYPYRSCKDKTRHNCYFVLCIKWESGVAKRQASGKVLAEVWERYQESVDLTLG